MNTSPQASPIVTGAILLAAGLLLRQWHPAALDLPDRPARPVRDRGARRMVRRTRDGIMGVLPSNLTGSLGRTLVVAGVGLVLVRLLDMTVDDDASIF